MAWLPSVSHNGKMLCIFTLEGANRTLPVHYINHVYKVKDNITPRRTVEPL